MKKDQPKPTPIDVLFDGVILLLIVIGCLSSAWLMVQTVINEWNGEGSILTPISSGIVFMVAIAGAVMYLRVKAIANTPPPSTKD